MTCLECLHWSLQKSPLRDHGFGLCAQETPERQAVHTTSTSNVCRLGKFKQAPAATVAKRQKGLL
jgi:hypothetical protein